INYQNKPVRVTPLRYGNWLKWFSNQSDGIPAYIKIDMATQNAECVKLKQGMKYTENDHFNRNIHRYLRFRYPTYIFDTLNFEIDEEGNPVYICPVKDYTIGLFGGETIQKVVIVNAVTGEHQLYDVEDVPEWVDRVYSADLLVSYYDYYGNLQHGYWNSVLSQKDCLKTTEGYNYIALDNDVWVYTGVTSVGEDQSNVGLVLMNQRTGKTKYYQVSGAEEYSAMNSAEGKVQHLNYKATFPLLLNVAGKPTYFICLKDSAGLVKQYAMVNIEKYTIVAIGNSVTECEKDYIAQLKDNGLEEEKEPQEEKTLTGKIVRMTEAVLGGNSHFYFLLENNNSIFDAPLETVLDIVKYKEGDTISFQYQEREGSNVVIKIG
ncbi:MAG: CvpA family protein, partial [Eubacterium sp.]|nr:CvpA family protein [Eubacterium sp.]